MVTIIIGEINSINQYHIDNILDKYHTALVINKSTSKGFKAWFRNIKRPIIGDRIMISISEIDIISRREFDLFKEILNEVKDHDYVDILWHISNTKGNFNNIVTDMELIILRKTYRIDFRNYIKEIFPTISDDDVLYIAERVGYNLNTFNLYKDKLIEEYSTSNSINRKIINDIITSKHLTPVITVLQNILENNRSGIKDYYLYCERYGSTWVNNFFMNSLEEILTIKIDYYKNGSIKLSDIKASDRKRKYFYIIRDVTISKVYTLLMLLRTSKYPLEMYNSISTNELLEEFLRRSKNELF